MNVLSTPKRLLLDTHYRVAIVESLYVEHLHTSIRFLVGVPTDKTILLDYAEQVLFLTDHLNLASGKQSYFFGLYE
jgi:hypothetical protein